MSAQVPSRPMTDEEPHESRWATGMVLFAGVVMMVTGVWHALAGLGALVNDKVYVSTPNYIYGFDLTGWGWIHVSSRKSCGPCLAHGLARGSSAGG